MTTIRQFLRKLAGGGLYLGLFVLAPTAGAVTVFSEDFEGYTSFSSSCAMHGGCDSINAGIPRISEGASEVWYGARFETPDTSASIDSDLAIQQYGGGSNNTHAGRFEDDAGLLFKLDTTGLTDIQLSFDRRTYSATSSDKLVVGYHVGTISQFGGCTGEGEAGCFADLRASHAWYTTEGGTTLTGDWTQLLKADASDTWTHESHALAAAAANQPEVWIAFWLDNGEGDYGKIDNVAVMATVVPIPAAFWLFGSGLAGIGIFARRRIMA